jgi:hypothetical protein
MEGRWHKTPGSGWQIRMPAGTPAKAGDRVAVKRADGTAKTVRLGMRRGVQTDGSVLFDLAGNPNVYRAWSGDPDPDYDDPSSFDHALWS